MKCNISEIYTEFFLSFGAMGDARRIGFNFPIIDLTNDNISHSNCTIPYFDLTRNDGSDTNCSAELIDLTDDNSQDSHSNTPVIDLTRDNDQVLNNKIPVIYLTDDHVEDIANQMRCIDLTNDGASSRNHTTQYFDLSNNDYYTNTRRERIDLTDNNQDFNTNIPVIDLTYTNEQIRKHRISDIDIADDDVQDITHQFQNIDLAYGKQQNVNDCIPLIDLTNDNDQSIDRNIPGIDLCCYKDYNNERPVIGLIRNNDNVIRNPADVVMNDDEVTSFNNLPGTLQETVAENNLRIPIVNLREDVTENNVLKCNETSNMNLMHVDTSRRMQQYYSKKETILANHPLTNNFEEKVLSPRRSEKTYQNAASNFMKPAHHPIPLRHSLGRSTVNTSKNVPIECTEDSEGQSRTFTVSSIIRRKKSKSNNDISKKNLQNSSESSTSRANTFSFETFQEFFLKLWTFVFYWIFKIILRFIELYGK